MSTFVGIESEIHVLRALRAAHAESGNDEQDERAGDLRDHHRAPQPLAAGAGRSAMATVVEERRHLHARRPASAGTSPIRVPVTPAIAAA